MKTKFYHPDVFPGRRFLITLSIVVAGTILAAFASGSSNAAARSPASKSAATVPRSAAAARGLPAGGEPNNAVSVYHCRTLHVSFCRCRVESKKGRIHSLKYWEIIADNLYKAGWSLGWVSALHLDGRMFFICAFLDCGRIIIHHPAITNDSSAIL